MPVGSPYGLEGYKTIAFELALQARQQPIDYVFVPVGGGDGLYGIYKGWREMLSLGLVDYLPHFVACQAVGANPVVRSFIERKKEVATVREAYSIATSTREETASDTALVALYESDGLAIDVTESEIIESIKLMATCGIFPEAASALSVACVRKAVATGCLPEGARVVAMITSAGIKWPAMLADLVEPSAVITPEFDTLREVIEID
jgi:threonine synthase